MRTGQKNQALITGRIAYGTDGTDAYALHVDTSGNLQMELLAGTAAFGNVNISAITAPTSIGTGTKACGTAGTRIQLSGTATACQAVIVTAKLSNTSTVVIGGIGVVASTATQQGTPLLAGDSVTLWVDNLTDIYLDALTTGEAVVYTYMV